MKFSWNWLSDYVDLAGIDPGAVADRFTLTVAELEGVEETGCGLKDVLVGRVAAVEPHPDADKLVVVEMDLGDRRVRGVSGAPNIRVGLVTPVALPGCRLPGGMEIKATDVRGVTSEVVVLSERETGLSDDHSGVIELPADTRLGESFPHVLPLEDVVFDVDNKSITHRPDLWGHHGVAREVAAMLRLPLKPLETEFPTIDADPLQVIVDDAADCPRYMAMCYSGVKVAPSPFWMGQRLRAVGMRPISNVVDVSNFVMLATGEPTHAFDMRQLNGDTIRVRRAGEGEPFRTLDGLDHELTGDDLLIADAERGVALAGVMGGENSEISDDTSDVVLECATFHPGMVRKTSVRHGLRTESSARFEKSLDPNLPSRAMALFTRLLLELSPGAAPSSRVYDVAGFSLEPVKVPLDPAYVAARLGVPVPAEKTRAILESLEFEVVARKGGAFEVTVPTFRATRDVSIPEDLVEEVGRVIGYDQVPPAPPSAPVALVPRDPARVLASRVRKVLSFSCGLDEVLTYSFDSREVLERIGFEPPCPVCLKNTLSSDMATLRTDLVPNLLAAVEKNAKRFREFGIYEVGRVFSGEHTDEGIPVQTPHVGLALYDRSAREVDGASRLFQRLKGIIQLLVRSLDLHDAKVEYPVDVDRPWMHPRRTVSIDVGGVSVGAQCGVHPATLKGLDVLGNAVVAEIDLDAVADLVVRERKFAPVPRFPSIQSDVSFVVEEKAPSGTLEELVKANGGDDLASVELVAVYSGPPVPAGFKSLSFSMTFQAPDRTLSEEEVKTAVDRVVAAARESGASIRDS
ncbi:MAG: phenylalanine--tRNA ligase subunit beta [Deltaproteobacteria bacterium]|nr:phenylalanine--tRNA ligase subunit beta [Deltaproteobacteria bacterium]